MNPYYIILFFFIWYALALWLSVTIGKKSKLGEEWSFFISFMLSPVVGFIMCKLMPQKN
ncbi:hypothetical protein ACFLRY_03950 [Bacteroidota bacterium]